MTLSPTQPTHSYQAFHSQLLQNLYTAVRQQAPFNQEDLQEEDERFLGMLDELRQNPSASRQGQHLGQLLISTIVARYPQVTPMVPRDLFWFFGGDALHYLGDEEIAFFQQLDEDYHQCLAERPDETNYGTMRASRSAS